MRCAGQDSAWAPSITPVFHIDLPGSDVDDVAVSADGLYVYAAVREPALNVGAAVDASFHWWATALCAVAVIVGLARIERVVRRPERLGEPHCRRCSHSLVDSRGAACAECGADLARYPGGPGRPFARRAWRWIGLTLFGLAGVAYVLGLAPRQVATPLSKTNWYSRTATRWATKAGVLVPARSVVPCASLLRIRTADGSVSTVGTAYNERSRWMAVLADGCGLVLHEPGVVRLLDMPGAREARRFTVGPGRSASIEPVLGGLAAGSEPTVVWQDQHAGVSRLLELSRDTGAVRTVMEAPFFGTDGRRGRTVLSNGGRGFAVVPGDGPVRYVSYSSVREVLVTRKFDLHWFGADGRLIAQSKLAEGVSAFSGPRFSSDGEVFHLYDDACQLRSYRTMEVAAGSLHAYEVAELPRSVGQGVPEVSSDGRLVFVNLLDRLLVRDAARKEWLAVLAAPGGIDGLRFTVSADGGVAAAIGQGGANKFASREPELVIWRVPRPRG